MSLTVACINVGTKYAPEYVFKLREMVRRHLHQPHRFVCYTDRPEHYAQADFDVLEERSHFGGWWSKIGLFNPDNGLEGRVLYLDIDVVLVRCIDDLLKQQGFWICQDWLEDEYNSSIIQFTVGEYSHLYEGFTWREKGVYKHDQDYFTKKVPEAEHFDPKIVQSYKLDKCEQGFDTYAKIIVFHGYPKPHECGGWVKDYWQ